MTPTNGSAMSIPGRASATHRARSSSLSKYSTTSYDYNAQATSPTSNQSSSATSSQAQPRERSVSAVSRHGTHPHSPTSSIEHVGPLARSASFSSRSPKNSSDDLPLHLMGRTASMSRTPRTRPTTLLANEVSVMTPSPPAGPPPADRPLITRRSSHKATHSSPSESPSHSNANLPMEGNLGSTTLNNGTGNSPERSSITRRTSFRSTISTVASSSPGSTPDHNSPSQSTISLPHQSLTSINSATPPIESNTSTPTLRSMQGTNHETFSSQSFTSYHAPSPMPQIEKGSGVTPTASTLSIHNTSTTTTMTTPHSVQIQSPTVTNASRRPSFLNSQSFSPSSSIQSGSSSSHEPPVLPVVLPPGMNSTRRPSLAEKFGNIFSPAPIIVAVNDPTTGNVRITSRKASLSERITQVFSSNQKGPTMEEIAAEHHRKRKLSFIGKILKPPSFLDGAGNNDFDGDTSPETPRKSTPTPSSSSNTSSIISSNIMKRKSSFLNKLKITATPMNGNGGKRGPNFIENGSSEYPSSPLSRDTDASSIASDGSTGARSIELSHASSLDIHSSAIPATGGGNSFISHTKQHSSEVNNTISTPLPPIHSSPLSEYRFLRCIGVGNYSHVFLVRNSKGDFYTLKSMRKKKLVTTKLHQQILREKQIMIKMMNAKGSSFMVSFINSFQDAKSVYLVMEWVPGGDLYSLLKRRFDGHMSEETARFYVAEVVCGLDALHTAGIIYR